MSEPRDVQLLQVVAYKRSLRAAASMLHCSPGSVDRRLRAMEEEIGAQLVKRSGRDLTLTPAGQIYLDATHSVSSIMDNAADAARSAAATGTVRLRIGHNSVTGLRILGDVLASLINADPPTPVAIYELPNSHLLRQIADGDLDLVMARPPVDDDLLSHEPLPAERLDVVVPADHHLAGHATVTLSDLNDELIILPPRSHSVRAHDLLRELCEREGHFQPRVIHHAANPASLLMLVALGAGISFFPRRWTRYYQSKGLASIPLTTPNAALPLHLVWRKTDHSPAVATSRTLILNAAQTAEARDRRRAPRPSRLRTN